MTQTVMLNLISLVLLLPTALCFPLKWSSLKGVAYKEAASQFDKHPHWIYTLTATNGATYPTATIAPINYLLTATTGMGTTTARSTATGYVKRNLEEHYFSHSFPTGFPTGFLTAFPTAAFPFPTASAATSIGYPSAAYSSCANELEELEELVESGRLKDKRYFVGPRPPYSKWTTHWDMPSTSASAVLASTAATSSGYARPTSTATDVPTYGW
ncbi:hypothetical protein LTR56_012857 [Elasticomyces elasticus]|nr:hypothetical protein LTR56_012857 [Elasticomyces elasticus]KAK3650783.1 hypothetical protein LTR22_012382 [Elasticomyces elasticus]KAK4918487.1 hypothetical protein LTR49_013720 [Elasticomyces elasticus]KAK5757874.1 hypothetical protein LTS12_012058 [Elasticomyces elasticus]